MIFVDITRRKVLTFNPIFYRLKNSSPIPSQTLVNDVGNAGSPRTLGPVSTQY